MWGSGRGHPWGVGGLPWVLSPPCRQHPTHNLKTFHDLRHQFSPGLHGDSLSQSRREGGRLVLTMKCQVLKQL